MRFLALILGLFAGIFALATPIAFKTDLMTPFIEHWASTPDARLAATLVWSALPVAALLGGILCVVTPGVAALLLLGAGLGWSGIVLSQPALMDFKLLVPAGAALLAAVCAQLAGELDIHRRRKQRRTRRLSDSADETGEIERETAFRIDPTMAPRQPARRPTVLNEPAPEPAPREPVAPPRRAVPLKFESEHIASTSQSAVPQSAYSRQETIQPSSPRRPGGFRWDDTDQPDIEPEPLLDQPRPSPRFEQRDPDRVAFVPRANQRRAEIQPELRSESRQSAQPPYRRPVPQRRNDSLAIPISLGIAAVLVLTALAGLYVAQREGYLDRIVTALQTATAEPTQLPAPAGASTTTASATAPAPAPAAAPTPASIPAPAPAATAPEAPPPVLPQVLPETATATATALTSATYVDPFAYCTAVGTIDFADERYTGPAVIPAMTEAVRAPADAPRERVHWRCAGGVVLACSSYAGPICDRAPTVAEMQAYCDRNPNARPLFAPHGVWSCVEGTPQLPPDVNWPVDDRGFMPRAWIAIRSPGGTSG